MAIVNRTPDSFYDRGATFALDAAVARVDKAVSERADIVDIGGVKAGHGPPVSEDEEIARTSDLVAAVPAVPRTLTGKKPSRGRHKRGHLSAPGGGRGLYRGR